MPFCVCTYKTAMLITSMLTPLHSLSLMYNVDVISSCIILYDVSVKKGYVMLYVMLLALAREARKMNFCTPRRVFAHAHYKLEFDDAER